MFKLSDAELLEFIAKRKAEKEAAAKAARKSSTDTDDIINSIQNGEDDDNVFDEYGEPRTKTKAEKRFEALKNDNNIIQSFLGRKSTNSDSNDEGEGRKGSTGDTGEPLIKINLEVTKALLLLGFSNWSSLESGIRLKITFSVPAQFIIILAPNNYMQLLFLYRKRI